jgi:predicted RNase H-like HicB family nuclease
MKESIHTFRIMIEKDGRGYHGFAPTLKGVHTYGKTVAETRRNLTEAIQCHLQGLAKEGALVPREEDAFEFVQSFSNRDFSPVGR